MFRNNRLITRVILLLLPNEQNIILVLKNTIRRDDPLSFKITLSEADRKWQLSTCWQAEDARLFLTDSHDSLLSFSRFIRHRRWPEPKSVSPIRMHLSANTRNQFAHARYFFAMIGSARISVSVHEASLGSATGLLRKDPLILAKKWRQKVMFHVDDKVGCTFPARWNFYPAYFHRKFYALPFLCGIWWEFAKKTLQRFEDNRVLLKKSTVLAWLKMLSGVMAKNSN